MFSTTVLLLALLAAETIALVVLAVLYRKEKKKPRLRRVEAPNSEFKSPYVENLEARDRWESMELERLHPVNREEVERLLEKVRAEGVADLPSSERDFLDRMARVASESREQRERGGRTPGRPPREVPEGS